MFLLIFCQNIEKLYAAIKKSQGKKENFRRKRKFYDKYTKIKRYDIRMGNLGICGE